MAVLLIVLFAVAVGGLAGIAADRKYGIRATITGRDNARYLDAVALARDLISTPDALDLRDRARTIVDRHEAATNRKDV